MQKESCFKGDFLESDLSISCSMLLESDVGVRSAAWWPMKPKCTLVKISLIQEGHVEYINTSPEQDSSH